MVVRKAYETLVQIEGYPSMRRATSAPIETSTPLYDGPKAPTIPSDHVAKLIRKVEVGAEA